MAVNLLQIANQLRGNLHNKSSGPRTRSADANEPGNLPNNSYIPGTNIKQGQSYQSTAQKGRMGDTKLRRVGGEVAHVNTTEANAIDWMGPLGEAWVENVGSGSTNPSTGLREYWKPKFNLVGLALGPILGQTDWAQYNLTHAGMEAKANGISKEEYIEGVEAGEDGNTPLGDERRRQEGATSFIERNQGVDWSTMDPSQMKTRLTDSATRGNLYGHMSEEDYFKYIDPYDTTKEDKLKGDYEREVGGDVPIMEPGPDGILGTEDDIESEETEYKKGRLDLAEDRLGIEEDKLAQGERDIGSKGASQMFGNLTASQTKQAKSDFAGQGDFGADFAQKQLMQNIGSQYAAQSQARKGIGVDREGIDIDRDQALADYTSGVDVLHDEYNDKFWEQYNNWDLAKAG